MNILVTGAGGSLGSAFYSFLKKDLNHFVEGIDSSEWAVAENPDLKLGDYVDANLSGVNLVIHCAAYKHINLAEENIHAVLTNNIVKYMKFIQRLPKYCQIMFISTDKAVQPISLYGYTKAIGEKLTWRAGGFVVRLGNIMGSSGSVIPIWEKAIAEKKPIPITSYDMVRWFCELDEAVPEIWDKYIYAPDKANLIIPKCEKITIRQLLAKTLIKHNLPPDYPCEVIGIRGVEKLEEKLRWEGEI